MKKFTAIRSKPFQAAALLALVGCADATEETIDQDEAAVSGLNWLRVAGAPCATSISVAADDTIWFTQCNTDKIWYMRLEGDFAQSPVWTETVGRAKRVAVDNGGFAWVIPSDNSVWRALFTNTSGNDQANNPSVLRPTGQWTAWGSEPALEGGSNHMGLPNAWFTRAPRSGGAKTVELLFNHQESVLAFHSSEDAGWCTHPTVGCYFYVHNDPLAFGSYEFGAYGAHEAYELLDNGKVFFKKTPQPSRIPVVIPPPNNLWKTSTTEWLSTSITDAKAMALFTPPNNPAYSRLLWTVNASGAMKLFDPTLPNFAAPVASPPSKTTSLTDHYALAADGVYEYKDSNQGWSRYLGNTTATGDIIQLAHSRKQNARGQSYTSSVWALDNAGVIYKAGVEVVIH